MMTIAASSAAEVDPGEDFCRAVTWISDDNRGPSEESCALLCRSGLRLPTFADSGRSSDPAALCVRGFASEKVRGSTSVAGICRLLQLAVDSEPFSDAN